MVRAYISDFCVQRPSFEFDQKHILEWLSKAHARHGGDVRDQLMSLGLGEGKILKRGMFSTDCSHENWDKMEVEGAPIEDRMAFFAHHTEQAIESFYEKSTIPSDVIHVSCTGYVAPSPLQSFIAKKGAKAHVTHAYHMGCYAAIPALRMAMGFLASGGSKVDVMHTELCSLHMGTHCHNMDQLVAETLFGDGLIKYSVGTEEKGFEILRTDQEFVPNTLDHMSWNLKNWGMAMTLSVDIPLALGRAIKRFVKKLYGDDLSRIQFAIHPGGSKIIEQVARILKLKDWQIQTSLDVFKRYGNMSSATLPHIWSEMDVKRGQEVVSLAFGPGLTIVGGVLRCC